MLNDLANQFLGGSGGNPEKAGSLFQQAPDNAVMGALSAALGNLGPGGFAQSVASGAESAGPSQRQGLAGLLLNAVEQGGGNPQQAIHATGINPENPQPQGLASLAAHVLENHPDALSSVLGNQMNSGGGGMLSVLGNPLVQQVAMHVAQRVL